MVKTEIIVIGAGACGLMVARELVQAGKKVIILEARDRVGGRILPLSEEEFGYPAQGGGEFVHGEAPITHSIIAEARLTYVPMQGEIWSARTGELVKADFSMPNEDLLQEKLRELKEDMSIRLFLNKYFTEEKYKPLWNRIIKMVEGYYAANPDIISTFSLREEWLGVKEWKQGRVREGYGAILDFLVSECKQNGVKIYFNKKVDSVDITSSEIKVFCGEEEYTTEKVVVTIPLPLIKSLKFIPAIPEKVSAAGKIGFGNAMKLLLRFKDKWWTNSTEQNLNKMDFVQCNGDFASWWTQYPETITTLTGWMAGTNVEKLKNLSSQEIVECGLNSLSEIFKVDKNFLKEQLINSKFINWPTDTLTLGGYSYSNVEAEKSYSELRKPIDNKIFFAGEALCLGKETATVEGAFVSGKEVAEKILLSIK